MALHITAGAANNTDTSAQSDESSIDECAVHTHSEKTTQDPTYTKYCNKSIAPPPPKAVVVGGNGASPLSPYQLPWLITYKAFNLRTHPRIKHK